MEWVKVYTRKWLVGSGRVMTPEKRGVWMDLLAMAGEAKLRDGILRFDVGKPYSRDYIANVLMLDRETLDACLVAFEADINADDGKSRITIWEDGTIQITNWVRFQSKPEKTVAREIAIERGKAMKKEREEATIALTRAVNELNKRYAELHKKLRYVATEDGKILDTETGAVRELPVDDKNKSGGESNDR